MSRIRSIHPGIWTDEAFVSLSAHARLLFMGIWNECDDKGTFPWSPLQMKMRVLPADNVDAAALMAELESTDCIRQYDIGGKKFGAVRNFAKFQRPKSPNDIHPATAEILAFAGHSGEPLPKHSPKPSEKPPQREEIKEEIKKEEVEPNGSCASGDALKPEHFVEAWNEDIAPLGKRSVRAFTPERRTLVKARIAQHGAPGCQEALANIRGSPFLLEAQGIQFDWVIQKKNFQKILEGNYNG